MPNNKINEKIKSKLRTTKDAKLFQNTIDKINNSAFPYKFEFECKEDLSKSSKRIIVISNHSGWFAFDGIYSMGCVTKKIFDLHSIYNNQSPENNSDKSYDTTTVVHPFLVKPPIKWLFPKMCQRRMLCRDKLISAMTTEDFSEIPNNICIYPEGEAGNTKSFLNAYQLAPFKAGFLRIAQALDADILITTTVGNEELFPSLCNVKLKKDNKDLVTSPIPVSPVPFTGPLGLLPFIKPTFKATIHELIKIDDIKDNIKTNAGMKREAENIRQKVQEYLNEEAKDYPLFKLSNSIKKFKKKKKDFFNFNIDIRL